MQVVRVRHLNVTWMVAFYDVSMRGVRVEGLAGFADAYITFGSFDKAFSAC